MAHDDEYEPLSFREKLGYGLGDTASNFYLGFFALFLLYYYTDVLGLAPAAVGTMMLVTKIIDAVSDPAMGLIADRTNSRWGKYRPYLLWVAVPLGLCGYALFHGPDLAPTGMLIYAYVTYSLVMLAYTAINVPYSALLGVISPLSTERTKATTYRFFCASAAGLAIGAFTPPLTRMLGGGDELLGFRLTMALFAAISVILFWVTFATTRERIAPERHASSVREDFRALLKNESWILLAVAGLLILTANAVRTASAVFYLKYLVPNDGMPVFLLFDRTALFLTAGALAQVVGVLFTEFLALRFDKHHLIIGLSLLNAICLLVLFVAPPENYPLVISVNSLGMMTFGPTIALLFAMYTDCADYGEWKTGKRTTGLIVSASMFSIKVGVALGSALPGFVLAATGFVANAEQTPTALLGIRLMFCILPIACVLLASAVIYFYRIDRAMLRRIETEMDERRHAQAGIS